MIEDDRWHAKVLSISIVPPFVTTPRTHTHIHTHTLIRYRTSGMARLELGAADAAHMPGAARRGEYHQADLCVATGRANDLVVQRHPTRRECKRAPPFAHLDPP